MSRFSAEEEIRTPTPGKRRYHLKVVRLPISPPPHLLYGSEKFLTDTGFKVFFSFPCLLSCFPFFKIDQQKWFICFC